MTKRDKIVEALLRRGYVQEKARSSKYLVFKHPRSEARAFVGKNGALRVGKTITESVSYSHIVEKLLGS